MLIVLFGLIPALVLCDHHHGYAEYHGYNQALRFPAPVSLNNYVIMQPDFSLIQSEVSVCTWINKYLNPEVQHMWFSYETARYNEILLSDYRYNHLHSNTMDFSKTILLKHEWYHFCFTWDTRNQMDLYINGVWVNSMTAQSGWRIQTGGTLILGQDQDSVGGGFEINQTFGGELYQTNVFKRKLRLEEVAGMFFNGRCADINRALIQDVVLSWEDLLQAERHGAVDVVSADCDKWNFLGDVTEVLVRQLNRKF